MEHGRNDDKEDENQDLKHQACQNNVLAQVHSGNRLRTRHYAAAGALDQKAEDVAADEDLCEPSGGDDTVFFTVDGVDDAAEVHVDGCGEENGSKEDEERLDRVRECGVDVVVGIYSGCVSCCLDWGSKIRVSSHT